MASNLLPLRGRQPLAVEFPVDATVEVSLTKGTPSSLQAKVYCTDEVSQTVVLTQAVAHSTLTHQVHCLSRHAIQTVKVVSGSATSSSSSSSSSAGASSTVLQPLGSSSSSTSSSLSSSLQVQQKALEAQEKRALKMAEEALEHINQNVSPPQGHEQTLGRMTLNRVSLLHLFFHLCLQTHDSDSLPFSSCRFSPFLSLSLSLSLSRCYSRWYLLASPNGQAVFDRLLKACNDVVWKNESIVVLSHIQVDPPYGVADCRFLATSGSTPNDASMERVRKIVGHGVQQGNQ